MAGTSQADNRKELFETMPIGSALMKLALPTIISQLINVIYNIVDTIYIGQTGDAYKTAAVTLAFTLFMMTVPIANMFGIGGGSLIARLMGKGEKNKAKNVSAFSFYGAIAAAVLYSVIIGVFQTPILNAFGASEMTLAFAKQYVLYVLILGNVPVILSMTTAHLLRNAGLSRQASIGLSMGGILNIILDPIFMFRILPPGMEVAGAAIATLISNIAACIYLVVRLKTAQKESPLSMSPRAAKTIGRAEIKELFSVGVPSALLTALFDVASIVLNSLMAVHGDLYLAATGIVMKTERIPNAINIGICQGMLPLVAYNYSSGNHKRMTDAIRMARIAGLTVSFIMLILYEISAPAISGLFLNESAAADPASALLTLGYAALFLRIRSTASPFQFLNYSTSFCMQAVGYGFGTMLHAFVRELGFYIPFMYLMNCFTGVNGLAAALPVGEFCGAMFALWLFRRWKRKHVKLLAQESTQA